jgi:hypothetical protein
VGKSKRSRKKNKSPVQERAATPQSPAEISHGIEGPSLNPTSKAVIGLILLAVLGLIVWLVHGSDGDIHTSKSTSPSSGSSSIQTGGTQPLGPSGSVDLQPTGSAAQAGSVQ